ncbi:MAG: type I restriction enzyme HsdR N-terminal domain-containing protein [Pseudarcicella sp.]|nr:type I restriction enzyme HsdR N-terminal domain-containing protein [Pseudarcicella sp.]MBP6410589.1 type I restriction enzyme HsdR N-terminal domain-containing protein [Pseudarcicella sp.]
MKLNLPEFDVKLSKNGDKVSIFDVIRKKYILLTPEEWVRQHFVHYMINQHQYPKGLIAIENKLIYGSKLKRTDIQVFTRTGDLFMIVECKAPYISIDKSVLDQAAQYNKILQAPYIILTNGIDTQSFAIDIHQQSVTKLECLPIYDN